MEGLALGRLSSVHIASILHGKELCRPRMDPAMRPHSECANVTNNLFATMWLSIRASVGALGDTKEGRFIAPDDLTRW